MRHTMLPGLVIALLLVMALGCTLESPSSADLTQTSEYLLNGGYPTGHPTSLPPTIIHERMTQTAYARTMPPPTQSPTPDHTATYEMLGTMYAPGGITGVPPISPTPSPTAIPVLTTQETDLTRWAQTVTVTPSFTPTARPPTTVEYHQTQWAELTATALRLTPTPTSLSDGDAVRWEEVRVTSEAYGTAHADAPGTLEVTLSYSGIQPSVTLTESQINELLMSQLANVSGARNVYVDLVPGGATISAIIPVGRRALTVSATTTLTVQDGALLLYLTRATIGNVPVPTSALDVINQQIIPAVNDTLNDVLAEYGSLDQIYLTAIEATNNDLTIDFVFTSP